MSKTLHLTLKKKWFDMIASGVKKEEYREIKPYWEKKLCREFYANTGRAAIIEGRDSFVEIDIISATNGYGKHRPNIQWKHKGIRIGTPNPEWCEPEDIGKAVFILEIGELI